MNEPFAGNIYDQPELLLPGIAGARNLKRMNDAVAMAIYEVDDKHMIFFEPVTWGMFLNGNITGNVHKLLSSGYTEPPGGKVYSNRSVFSFHYYCAILLQHYQTEPDYRRVLCDSVALPLVLSSAAGEASAIGGSLMQTEGMSCAATNLTTQEECIAVQEGTCLPGTACLACVRPVCCPCCLLTVPRRLGQAHDLMD